jgi:hypothetical protein
MMLRLPWRRNIRTRYMNFTPEINVALIPVSIRPNQSLEREYSPDRASQTAL